MNLVDIVIPTIGRASLHDLLRSLADSQGALRGDIIIVDDRKNGQQPLNFDDVPAKVADRIRVVQTGGQGPAAARNAGWKNSSAQWIAFLDDDVRVEGDWLDALRDDISSAEEYDGAVSGYVRVPLPEDRKATDWERNVAGLEHSWWITADMAYRRKVLEETGGFDTRFPRAYREDADLALRAQQHGYRIFKGRRRVTHPVRAGDFWISVRMQAGNADDALMRVLHGRDWRERARAGNGRFPLHLFTVALAAGAGAAAAMRKRNIAMLLAGAWAAATAEFAWRRISPGPRTPDEIAKMTATSAVIPFAAVYHRARGYARLPRASRETHA
jgi:glycosyltransferase involved in cell wall biosynthesis